MNKVYACIDGLSNTTALIDWAVWSALRLDVPLEFLHVLDSHPERAQVSDYSGTIGLDARESLLNELIDLDAQRSKLAQEAGQRVLAAARSRAKTAGIARVDSRLRHGELVDNVLEMEPDARLFVLGEHHHAHGGSRLHMDHNVERVIRSVKRPVLIATADAFAQPARFVIAFDGSPTGYKTVETVARSPMLVGMQALVVMVGEDHAQARRQLEQARQALLATGFDAQTSLLAGEPEKVLPELVGAHPDTMLVMGAYGHSRIRQLIIGSTTTTLLRLSQAPVLILR